MRLSASFETAAFFAADDCQPCLPGDPVRLEGILSGLSLSGTVTVRGQTYRLGGGNFDAGAHLVFTGQSSVMPAFTTDGTVALEAPFGLTGALTVPGSDGVGTRYALSGKASPRWPSRNATPLPMSPCGSSAASCLISATDRRTNRPTMAAILWSRRPFLYGECSSEEMTRRAFADTDRRAEAASLCSFHDVDRGHSPRGE